MTDTSPLHQIFLRDIRHDGPLSLADYMTRSLLDPKYGYYQRDQVFGCKGDFITAPEISQMFGEMLGLALLERWQNAGCPYPVRLIELGPGRGTLMADMIRVMQRDEKFSASIHFIEASHSRKAEQKTVLPDSHHHMFLEDVPKGFSLIVANEFFDALPIRQFQFDKGLWRERVVGEQDGTLVLGLADPVALPQNAMIPTLPTIPSQNILKDNLVTAIADGQAINQGAVIEISDASLEYAALIARRLQSDQGFALMVDYGYLAPRFGSSFQAVKDHKFVNPFEAPGLADLTAHVNFAALKRAFEQQNIFAFGPLTQGDYLMALGIGQRALQLSQKADAEKQSEILESLKRLTAPEGMGTLFKVMAVSSAKETPPGFEQV